MNPLRALGRYAARFAKVAVVMAALIGVMAGSLVVIGPQLYTLVSSHRSNHTQVSLKPLAERSYIYDSLGNEQGVLTNRDDPQNRVQVKLSDIPETVKGSVIATEDANFYNHMGVNVRSILRAVDANLNSGEVSQGGSTITQQVVKNAIVGDKQNLSRKLNEAFLAVELEKQLSKDEILEYYLNSVYFGGGAYGVQAASQYYFNRNVEDLGWAEGALLASLIRSPNSYNPFNNPEVSKKRRDLVFRRLVTTERLDASEVDLLDKVSLPTKSNPPPIPSDYFVEEVKQQLLADPKFGLGATETARNRAVFEGGIRVYTTFNPEMQRKATTARDETLPANRGDATFDVGANDPITGEPLFGTAAMASIEPSSGAVRVMVGGAGFDRYQFNLVNAERQPGSTMKTFVMATLFEQGYVPSDTVRGGCSFRFPGSDEVITYQGRSGTIQFVTQKSSNCGYMKLGQKAGIVNVAELANKVGVKQAQLYLADADGNPTAPPNNLPLGSREISPLEMASAYATFANDGFYNDPYLVERIEDRNGKVLYQHQAAPVAVVSAETARMVTQVLEANVAAGTGTAAQLPTGQVAAGKTGTTDDSSDIWFVGYTPQLSTAIWMGAVGSNVTLAANPELRGASGGKFPAATWGRFYTLLTYGQQPVDFTAPSPYRSGKNVGVIPNLLGSSGSSSSRTGTTRGTPSPRITPTTPPATTPPANPAPPTTPPATAAPPTTPPATAAPAGGAGG